MEIDTSKVTRFEVIDHRNPAFALDRVVPVVGFGRTVITNYTDKPQAVAEISLQDDGRTLKVFLRDRSSDV